MIRKLFVSLICILCIWSYSVKGATSPKEQKMQKFSIQSESVWIVGQSLLMDASQIASNTTESDQFSTANLLLPEEDGFGTGQFIYHASWSNPLPQGVYPYLQVHFDVAQSDVIFTMISSEWSGTFDTPDDVEILATNTPDDESSWTSITELTHMISNKSVHPIYYTSPHVALGNKYTDVRFVVKATENNRLSSTGSLLLSLGRFQVFEAVEKQDAMTRLSVLIDSLSQLNLDYQSGTNPGYYPEEFVKQYVSAYETASFSLSASLSDDEYANLEEQLRKAYSAIEASMIPITDGYYYFINSLPGFEEKQNVKKAMYVTASDELKWATFNEKDPRFLFKVSTNPDGTFYIQCVGNNKYIGTASGEGVRIPLVNEPTVKQLFTFLKNAPQFGISNEGNDIFYNANGDNDGNGSDGYVVTFPGAVNEASAWLISRQVDQNLIDSLAEVAPKDLIREKLQLMISTTQSIRQLANEYDVLITDGSQITSNSAESDLFTPANLIRPESDGYGTNQYIFHSSWSNPLPANVYPYLQVHLNNSLNAFSFSMISSEWASTCDTPDKMKIYATNTPDDESSWTTITELSNMISDKTAHPVRYTSSKIDLGADYTDVRFEVESTVNNRPTSTGGFYLSLGRFQMMSSVANQKSEYYQVEGMKDACDKFDALLSSVKEKLANGTATIDDGTALTESANAIQKLYIDRDKLDSDFANLLDKANTAYNDAVPTLVPMISSGSQITANSTESDQFTTANLIRPESDGYGTNQYIFHVSWSDPLPADVDPYLQVHLNSAVNSFLFNMISSEWSSTYDTPNRIDILATNTPDNESSWTSIIELSDMIADKSAHPIKYTSPMIELGNTYTDIRFVVKETVNDRHSSTGSLLFNLGRFQLYSGIDPQRVQYNYNPEVKVAADELKVIIDAGKNKGKHEVWQQDIDVLQNALDKLKSSFADTTELVSLYNKLVTYAGITIVGDEVGCLDNKDNLNTFLNDIHEARYGVDAKQPMKTSIDAAVTKIQEAQAIFMSHINKIEPNKWYYIVSKSNLGYCSGKAIYSQETNTGNEFHFGLFNANDNTNTYEGNPAAVWRLVPIKGTPYYAIQNMGTSHYFGPSLGRGTNYRNHAEDTVSSFRVDYIGKGQIQFVSINNIYKLEDQIHAQESDSVIVPWPVGIDGASSWGVIPVEDEAEMHLLIQKNSIRIMTLPFDIPAGKLSLMNINDDVITYSLKSLSLNSDNSATLELTQQEEIKAGVPFFITYGDYTKYNKENETSYIFFAAPNDVNTLAKESNGLIGTLNGLTLQKPGLGYADGKLGVTDENAINILGQSGYIDPRKVETQTGAVDLTIVLKDGVINSIKSVANEGKIVNVYTLDGKVVKHNINKNEAAKELQDGIYIIGKQKIAIK